MTLPSTHFLSANIPAGGPAPTTSAASDAVDSRSPKRVPSPSVGRGGVWGATPTMRAME